MRHVASGKQAGQDKRWPRLINEIIFKSSALLIKSPHCVSLVRIILCPPYFALSHSLSVFMSLSVFLLGLPKSNGAFQSECAPNSRKTNNPRPQPQPDLRRMPLSMDEMIRFLLSQRFPCLLPPPSSALVSLVASAAVAVHCSLHYPFAVLFLAFCRVLLLLLLFLGLAFNLCTPRIIVTLPCDAP